MDVVRMTVLRTGRGSLLVSWQRATVWVRRPLQIPVNIWLFSYPLNLKSCKKNKLRYVFLCCLALWSACCQCHNGSR